MNVIEVWIIVTSMLSVTTLLGHSTASAISDTLELGSYLSAVSLMHHWSISVDHKSLLYRL